MTIRSLLSGAALLAASVSAQTYSTCNPLEKNGCSPDPAIAATFESDFTAGQTAAMQGWKTTAGNVTFGADGAEFTVAKQGDAPTIQTTGYFQFGYIEVKAKAAPGQGIISSIVLESDDLDEVDWEFLGGNDAQVQTNYFGKGDTTTFDRMIPYTVADPQQTAHTYAVNWTAASLVWLIDGVAVRTLNYADAQNGARYPQTPMNLRIGIWAGGDPSNEAGTIAWAGGETNYTQGPFTMTLQSVRIVNYSPGCSYTWSTPAAGGFSDGSYESIVVNAGNCSTNATTPTPTTTTGQTNTTQTSGVVTPSSGLETGVAGSTRISAASSTCLGAVTTTITALSSTGGAAVIAISSSLPVLSSTPTTSVPPLSSPTTPSSTATHPTTSTSNLIILTTTTIPSSTILLPPPPSGSDDAPLLAGSQTLASATALPTTLLIDTAAPPSMPSAAAPTAAPTAASDLGAALPSTLAAVATAVDGSGSASNATASSTLAGGAFEGAAVAGRMGGCGGVSVVGVMVAAVVVLL